jgi:hypothetical protein
MSLAGVYAFNLYYSLLIVWPVGTLIGLRYLGLDISNFTHRRRHWCGIGFISLRVFLAILFPA